MTTGSLYGEQSFRVVSLFGTSVHTNVEAIAIMLATGFAASSLPAGVLIVACFALGTGLHLGCHWLVALSFGKGIDRMVLTRAGRIDYAGAPPRPLEGILRTAAGPTMNALCAGASYAALAAADVASWPPLAISALTTFAGCSAILAAINFLPAIPFDGGLILRDVLSLSLGPPRALRIAAWISLGLLALMGLLGGWLIQPVLIYVAVTIAYDNWNKHLRAAPAA